MKPAKQKPNWATFKAPKNVAVMNITPLDKVHGHSVRTRELLPEEPHALRRQPPRRPVPGPQDGPKGGEAARPRATSVELTTRDAGSVRLW